MNKAKALYRVFKRRINYRIKNRPGFPEYLKEQVSLGLLMKMIKYSKKDIFTILNEFEDKKIIILKNQDEMDNYLKRL